MSTTRVSTIAAMIATLALSATPALAQEGRRGGGDQQQSQSRGARRRPDGNAGRQGARAQRAEPQQGNRGAERREAVPRSSPRDDNQARRAEPERRDRNDGWRGDRDRDRGRDRGPAVRYAPRYNPPGRVYRYAPRPRVYVAPYGYRPYGYRPGWSVNLYFGRPYAYTYPGYYAGRNYGYGYYSIAPGFVYGSLRIVDAPRYAQVFVDGYYAGVVDDYDGIFQRLNLEPGGYQVEVEVYQGAPPLTFDVYIEPGRTVTIHARP
ncbi:MAG: hypothetical protein AB7O28_10630 [Vicinamibacterales bacterium]